MVAAGDRGLERRRLLHGAVLGGHAVHPEGHLRGGHSSTAPAASTPFFRITLPLLRDTVSVAWVYLGFIALDMYALVFVMTPSQGGPNHASEIFASVLNFTAFQQGAVRLRLRDGRGAGHLHDPAGRVCSCGSPAASGSSTEGDPDDEHSDQTRAGARPGPTAGPYAGPRAAVGGGRAEADGSSTASPISSWPSWAIMVVFPLLWVVMSAFKDRRADPPQAAVAHPRVAAVGQLRPGLGRGPHRRFFLNT